MVNELDLTRRAREVLAGLSAERALPRWRRDGVPGFHRECCNVDRLSTHHGPEERIGPHSITPMCTCNDSVYVDLRGTGETYIAESPKLAREVARLLTKGGAS